MSKDFIISFYIERIEDAGFYAWLSQSSPKAEFGRGATIYEAIENLCYLLRGEFTKPANMWKIERQALLKMTNMLDEHPEGYNGPCMCKVCCSYGD